MTDTGRQLIDAWYSRLRAAYVERHPGCNENDVERFFLSKVAHGLTIGLMYHPEPVVADDDWKRIDDIR